MGRLLQSPITPPAIAILGTGAMARQWADKWSPLGPLIVGKAAPPYIIHDDGQEHVISPPYLTWEDIPDKSPNIVLLSIKWRGMEKARQWIEQFAQDALVISLLNGMGQEEAFSHIPGITLSVGITTSAATRKDMGNQRHTYLHGSGTTIVTVTNHPLERFLMTANQEHQWGWKWVAFEEARRLRWQKLVQNSIINPLTALADCPNGELPRHPLWRLAPQLLKEAEMIAKASGITLPPNMLERVEELLQKTHQNTSSMRKDVQEGLETEILAINGFLVKQADQFNISVPAHQALFTLISSLSSDIALASKNAR